MQKNTATSAPLLSKDTTTSGKPFIRPPYWRESRPTPMNSESLTQQAGAEAADINNIVKRYHRDGFLPNTGKEAQYLDCTGLQGDLTERLAFARETLETAGRYLDAWKEPEKPQDAPEAPQEPQPA